MAFDIGSIGSTAGATATNVMNTAVTLIFWILILAVFGAVIYIAYKYMQYKHRVRVRYITGGTVRYIIDDRARELKEEGGKVAYWQLLRMKKKIPVPPAESIQLGKKGFFYVECYYTDEEGFIFTKDTVDPKKPLDPLTTNQKLVLINQIKKAQSRKQQTLSELLFKMAPVLAIIMIFVVMALFWKDITAPMVEVSNNNAQISHENARILQGINELKFNIQKIESAQTQSTDLPLVAPD